MSPVAQLENCSACFNKNAAPAVLKPSIPLHDICPCYRPKASLG